MTEPRPADCTNPCIACMTDESHDPTPAPPSSRAAKPAKATAPTADRAALRQQIARALVRYDWNAGLSGRVTPSAHHYGEADAVMAALPAPADRATVLREAADRLDRLGLRDLATRELRRMADEAETGGAR
ncbi:hypothetical protein [Streptomyces albidoflavus]|uniref:hypothetical protein n=1 Tax=Streptomyces albidoflavus TaxID=1886 RepID=UPI0033F5B621